MRHAMAVRLVTAAATVLAVAGVAVAGAAVDTAGAVTPRPGAVAVSAGTATGTPAAKGSGLWGTRVVTGARLTCPTPARTTGSLRRVPTPVTTLVVCPPPASGVANPAKPRTLLPGTAAFRRVMAALSLRSIPPIPGQRCPLRPATLLVVYARTYRGITSYVQPPTDGCGFTRHEVTAALATLFPTAPR